MDTQFTAEPARRRIGANAAAGVQIEIVTIVWMTIEAVVAIAAGILAASVALTAFGADSVIELVSGGVLLWRLRKEALGMPTANVELAERRAAWITGVALALLCVYVLASSVVALLLRMQPDQSIPGIILAMTAILVMPVLAWRKRDIAGRIESAALRSDATCSITCAYMAGALLAGLACHALFGWWWADAAAALVFLVWLVPETSEALTNARAGWAACACCD